MRKRTLIAVVSIFLLCTLLPCVGFGSAMLSTGTDSLNAFVSSTQSMLNYQSLLTSASTAQDFYNIAMNAGFQQDAMNFINTYTALKNNSWVLTELAAARASGASGSFGQSAWNLMYYANQLNSANSVQEYMNIIADGYFLQAMDDFVASYNDLLAEWGLQEEEPVTTTNARYYPSYPLREGIPAVLIMRMATRIGPSTAYSEELGTFPQETAITVIEQAMGNDIPWGMVEFVSNGQRYRAYTGMKRIAVDTLVPFGNATPVSGATVQETEAYYGPGFTFARHSRNVPANTQLNIYGTENGFILCDFQRNGEWIRAYVPDDPRVQ